VLFTVLAQCFNYRRGKNRGVDAARDLDILNSKCEFQNKEHADFLVFIAIDLLLYMGGLALNYLKLSSVARLAGLT